MSKERETKGTPAGSRQPPVSEHQQRICEYLLWCALRCTKPPSRTHQHATYLFTG